MAVKIIRQPNKIALIGAPTSAASHFPGLERAPGALRAAGLVERLQQTGHEVTDLGDIPPQLFQEDEENPHARNVGPVLAALEALKPRVEQAYKSGALPVVLGGDCIVALATLAGVRRYVRQVSLLYCDSDADLNTPTTTPSGRFDGMVVAHVIGRGAAELVRFWSEPPLVREPDVALFGTARLDPPEREFLERSMMRRFLATDIQRLGPAAAARAALDSLHAASANFVLHLDVDVISQEDFAACNFPGTGGLRLDAIREALEVMAQLKTLAALEVTAYNPERDPDGSGAKLLVELLAGILAARLAALTAPAAVETTSSEHAAAAPGGAPSPPSTGSAGPGVESPTSTPPETVPAGPESSAEESRTQDN